MTDRASFSAAERLLDAALADRVAPAVVAEVGSSVAVTWTYAAGTLTFDADSPATQLDTVFDLASLTKPVATTTAVLRLVEDGRLSLDEPVGRLVPEWLGTDRAPVTVADLLEHTAGLSARLVDQPPSDARSFEHDICAMPLEYIPRSRSLYTDLGFILLGFIAARLDGRSLSEQSQALLDQTLDGSAASSGAHLLARVPSEERLRTAPTLAMVDDTRRGRTLTGEVHDNYAAALGGFAGHAGLFGTAAGVGAFGQAVLRAARGDAASPVPVSQALIERALQPRNVPGSSRALGWDTMRPTSSCGRFLSAGAIGHVGFTGTSLWIDPARDRYFVLLTNRVCGGGSSDDMQRVRRAFHDSLATV